MAAIAALTCWPQPTEASTLRFEQIYVFGDSLSDTGNMFQATGGVVPPSPPYQSGRFSNGPVWVEQLTSKLAASPHSTVNFAFAGATTGVAKASNFDSTLQIPGLLSQVKDFQATHPSANPNALYIVWAGANDYLGGTRSPAGPLNNLSQAVRALAAGGAKNFLVVNLPDLGKLPATRNNLSASTLTRLTKAHNSGLSQALDPLRQSLAPGTKLTLLDVNALFNQAMAEPRKSGFTNVTSPCLDRGVACNSPNEFLFWDQLHPTAAAHRAIGTLALAALMPPSTAEPFVEGSVLAIGTGVAVLQSHRLQKCKRSKPRSLGRSSNISPAAKQDS